MKWSLLIPIFIFSLSLCAQTLKPSDPCFSQFSSAACIEKVRSNIFFVTGVDGKVRAEHDKFLQAYFNKHGVAGFFTKTTGPMAETLFEYALDNSRHNSLCKKLIEAYPREQMVDGKNIFAFVIPRNPPFPRASEFDNYIHNLKLLFPESGNENYQITKDKFGLPWDDPLFASGYQARVREAITRIEDDNSFFNKAELLSQKAQLEKILARMDKLVELPQRACALKSFAEYEELKQQFGELLHAAVLDIPGCLIKDKKFALLKEILLIEPQLDKNYPVYFDQVIDQPSTDESYALSEFLYSQMIVRGQRVIPKAGEGKRAFLERASSYLGRYGEALLVCQGEQVNTGVLENLNRNMQDIIFQHAYAVMKRMLAEKDLTKKQQLMDQLAEIAALGVPLDRLHPQSGQSLMHLIADAGDEWVYAHLHPRIDTYAIGALTVNRAGEDPTTVALKHSSLEHMRLAHKLFRANFKNYEELKAIRKKLRKMKSKNDEYEAARRSFLGDVKIEMWE